MADDPVALYTARAPARQAPVCRMLRTEIDGALPRAGSKIWHAMPVWFVGKNPVVGFKVSAGYVTLLFWNGQSFGDATLKAAQLKITEPSQVDPKTLRHWLKLAGTDIWDYQGLRAGGRAVI